MLIVLSVLGAALAADVVINEVMVNPHGSDTEESTEWIELYNASEDAVNLEGWTLAWGLSSYSFEHALSSFVLEPGEHYVISEEGVGAGDEPAVLGFGNASSSADAIQIRDATGAVHDTLVYGADNPDAWIDNAGTEATSLAPTPEEGVSIGRHTDGVDSDLCGDDFVLFDSPSMGAINLLSIEDGDGDGDGDADADADADADDTAWVSPDCETDGSIKINEFMPNPEGSGTALEWVELYNSGAETVELDGWVLSMRKNPTSSGKTVTFGAGVRLDPGDFFVIGGEEFEGADLTADLDMGDAGSNADLVQVLDCAGEPHDTVVYGNENSEGFIDDTLAVASSLAPKPSDGVSLARVRDGEDTDLSGLDFVKSDEATPGASNPYTAPIECEPGDLTIKINELMPDPTGSDADQEWIELYNSSSSTVSLDGWKITWNTSESSGGDYSFGGGVDVASEGFVLVGGSLVADTDYSATISMGNATENADRVQLVDCEGVIQDTVVYGEPNDGEEGDSFLDDWGDVATSLAPKPSGGMALARLRDGQDTEMSGEDFALATEPSPGTSNPAPPECTAGDGSAIKVNELMPNPEGSDDGFEWVELYNTSSSTVTLDGWMVTWNTSESSGGGYMFGSDVDIGAGDFILVGGPSVEAADFVAEIGMGNASSNADRVQLVDCDGEPQDTVIYGTPNDDGFLDDLGEVTSLPALKPGDGQALARTADGEDTDVSFYDFVLTEDATPGEPNPYIEPVVCVAGEQTIKINELLPDPDGKDGEQEFVEIYNPTSEEVSLDGWGIAAHSSEFPEEPQFTFPGGTRIAARGFLVVGGEDVDEADIVMDDDNDFTLGNASKNPDGVRLVDCDGYTVQDTVLYGDSTKPIEDFSIKDDQGTVTMAGMPRSGLTVGRIVDGEDTDDNEVDFAANMAPTPGSANGEAGGGAGDGSELDSGGCGCGGKDGPGDADSPAEASAVGGLLASLAMFVAMRRRQDA